MTKSIRTHITPESIVQVRNTLAAELTNLVGDTNRSFIQAATAAAGHKVTTARLRKILTGQTDPTLMDVLAIASALPANALPAIVRTINQASKETTQEAQ